MIEIRVHPTGVERVILRSESSAEEDRDLHTWRQIRPVIERLHDDLADLALQAALGEDPQS